MKFTPIQSHTAKIMIIDDTPENLNLLQVLLKGDAYAIVAFPRGAMAISAALKNPPDLILLDINMPDMNGYEVCRRMKQEETLKNIPILFISANDSSEDKVNGFLAGGVDYVTKPFKIEELRARINTHLTLVAMRKELEGYNRQLEDLVRQKIEIIEESHISTTLAMVKLTENRDNETGQHIDRTRLLCKMVAQQLREMSKYKEVITDAFIKDIYNSAALHDIGKIGVPDAILLKPGKLTPEEWEIMKRHTIYGANTLDAVLKEYDLNEFIKMGRDIALSHHEKWDGTGYPQGLSGEDIPLSARIMIIVDIYDALRSKRPYKEAFTQGVTMEIIWEYEKSYFDPDVFKAFLALEEAIIKLY